MSWRETSRVEERVRFCMQWESGEQDNFSIHCARFGISRTTGYKWLEVWDREGPVGMGDRSRRPLTNPFQTPPEVEALLVEQKNGHRSWGPKKLISHLRRTQPQVPWPAPSTAGSILKRHGMVAERKARRRVYGQAGDLVVAQEPNHLWCADFKGWWHTGDGSKCCPLTITDQATRYILRATAMGSMTTGQVQAVFEAAFREMGLPLYMRSDNGPPFAIAGLTGITHLSKWWILLGITPERIAPGKPQQNGRHERMHGTMAREVEAQPAYCLREQQAKLEAWREEFNHVRPHEALSMATPGSLYTASPRPMPSFTPREEYDTGLIVRSVDNTGKFRWKSASLFLSHTLGGHRVALVPEEDDQHLRIMFCHVPVARLDTRTNKLLPIKRQSTAGGGGVPPHPPPPG